LQAALDEADPVQLDALLHQTIGAAGSYGFAQLSECASLLQDAVRERQEQSLLQELVDEFSDLAQRAAADVLETAPVDRRSQPK
ncbi:MAG: Hpt domain-containing protein, partial [Planctomycetaceae bacterium]